MSVLLLNAPFAKGEISLRVTENGFGWQQRVSEPEDANPIIDLSDDSADWMLAHNADGAFDGFNYFARKIGTPLIQMLGTSGETFTQGSNTFDQMQVYFTATDAEILGVEIGDLGIHFGVSWLGSNDGTGTLSWRIAVDTTSLMVFHWWNHGSGFRSQTFRVTLFSEAGEIRQVEEFSHEGESFATYLSEVLITGSAPGDFVIMEQQGHNVGWRGTMVVMLDDGSGPEGPVPGEWVETDSLGDIYYYGANWWWSPVLATAILHTNDTDWFFHPELGWLSMAAGSGGLAAETGGFFFSVNQNNWLWLSADFLPDYYSFGSASWQRLPNP